MKWIFLLLCYLLGSIPSGVIVARFMGGRDPRLSGSGNIGTTNVLRTLGKKAALATLLGDLGKGLLPVLLARLFLPADSAFIFLAAGAAILGHDFSFLLHFRGGKGVATSLGALIGLSLSVALLCLAVWILAVLVTRYSSAGALSAAAACPLISLAVSGPGKLSVFCAAAGALLWITHGENIRRLIDGTENRIHKPGAR